MADMGLIEDGSHCPDSPSWCHYQSQTCRGDVQEAFRYLKGWYQNELDSMARPCPQIMERQTAEQVALYAKMDSPGDPLPINIDLVPINNRTPTDAKV
jgi:hypothetical protein